MNKISIGVYTQFLCQLAFHYGSCIYLLYFAGSLTGTNIGLVTRRADCGFPVFSFNTKIFHRDWRVRGGTIGGDLYLVYLFVCPSRVEVSFSSVLEVPSRTEVVHERALLQTRYLCERGTSISEVPLQKRPSILENL
jgi:hypothetical protein